LVNFGEAVNFPLILGFILALFGIATLLHLLGVATGQVVWRAFATNLGAVPVATVPVWLIVVLGAAVLVAANLLAVAPALAQRDRRRSLNPRGSNELSSVEKSSGRGEAGWPVAEAADHPAPSDR
jgi:hypothetical protein